MKCFLKKYTNVFDQAISFTFEPGDSWMPCRHVSFHPHLSLSRTHWRKEKRTLPSSPYAKHYKTTSLSLSLSLWNRRSMWKKRSERGEEKRRAMLVPQPYNPTLRWPSNSRFPPFPPHVLFLNRSLSWTSVFLVRIAARDLVFRLLCDYVLVIILQGLNLSRPVWWSGHRHEWR